MNKHYVSKYEIDRLDKRIELLKAEAKESELQAKKAFQTQMRALEDKHDLLKAKLARANRQVGGATEEMQKGVKQAWIEVRESFDKAINYLH